MTQPELVNGLRAQLDDAVLEVGETANDTWVRVSVDAWGQAAAVCRNLLELRYFSFLSGMDWQPNPNLDGEKVYDLTREPQPMGDVVVDPVVRVGGGTSRFQLMARVYDVVSHTGITLTTDLDDEAPSAPTWTGVYKGADWHEREVWEMFGFDFVGHPNLRHMYLPSEFEGHPLRKDYPLLARVVRPWPGLVDMEDMPAAPESSAEGDSE